jgi:hypothetical protein
MINYFKKILKFHVKTNDNILEEFTCDWSNKKWQV